MTFWFELDYATVEAFGQSPAGHDAVRLVPTDSPLPSRNWLDWERILGNLDLCYKTKSFSDRPRT